MPGLTVPCNSQSHCMKIRTTWQIVLWPESSHMGSRGFRLNIQRRTYLKKKKKNGQRGGSYGAFHTYTPGLDLDVRTSPLISRPELKAKTTFKHVSQHSVCCGAPVTPVTPLLSVQNSDRLLYYMGWLRDSVVPRCNSDNLKLHCFLHFVTMSTWLKMCFWSKKKSFL